MSHRRHFGFSDLSDDSSSEESSSEEEEFFSRSTSMSLSKSKSKNNKEGKNTAQTPPKGRSYLWLYSIGLIFLIVILVVGSQWFFKYRKVSIPKLFSSGEALLTASSPNFEVYAAS